MSENTNKWVVTVLCLVTICFSALSLWNNFTFIRAGWIEGTRGVLFTIMDMTIYFVLIVASFLLIMSVFRKSYSMLPIIYCGVAVAGVIYAIVCCTVYFTDKSRWIMILVFAVIGVVTAVIAILLIVSRKQCNSTWLITISSLLGLCIIGIFIDRYIMITNIFIFPPVLAAELLVNYRLTKMSRYDSTTEALLNLKKQYESGMISEEEYKMRKNEVISHI